MLFLARKHEKQNIGYTSYGSYFVNVPIFNKEFKHGV